MTAKIKKKVRSNISKTLQKKPNSMLQNLIKETRSVLINKRGKILYAIFGFICGLLFSVVVFYCSSGYKSGSELERFLKAKVISAYETQTKSQIVDEKSEISIRDRINPYGEDVIVIAGYLKSASSVVWDIRYVAVFEKNDLTVIDNMLKRPSGYILSASFFINSIETNEILIPIDGKIEDLNDDGAKEIFINFHTTWADRESLATIMIDKDDEQWRIATIPNVEEILNEAYTDDIRSIFYDVFNFSDITFAPIVSLSDQAYYWYFVDNGIIKLFVRAIDFDEENSIYDARASYYFLFSHQNGVFVQDSNWNLGLPLIVEADSNLSVDQIYESGIYAQMQGTAFFYEDQHIGVINE